MVFFPPSFLFVRVAILLLHHEVFSHLVSNGNYLATIRIPFFSCLWMILGFPLVFGIALQDLFSLNLLLSNCFPLFICPHLVRSRKMLFLIDEEIRHVDYFSCSAKM